MLNQVILVGRLVKSPELQLTETGRKMSLITLAVPRSYKNINGEYDTDFLDCTLWTNIAENTAEYCKTGDVIGIKGRVQSRLVEKEDGTKIKKTDIIAEKVTFLSSGKISKTDNEADNNMIEDNDENISNDNNVEKVSKVAKKSK
ncbi:MAG: single-stranded DNA-binding protein [Erysipelotrichaceae bacterium]|nr:single-stranded DNA-binding protein [Erysipelotrichaceae bacterium]MDD6093456.1 single-stranded DNA-binding protein [bacterium]MDY3934895.1 single-stranded DNA-binding protein [Bacilli bacterium]